MTNMTGTASDDIVTAVVLDAFEEAGVPRDRVIDMGDRLWAAVYEHTDEPMAKVLRAACAENGLVGATVELVLDDEGGDPILSVTLP